jgi:hypothetical protein
MNDYGIHHRGTEITEKNVRADRTEKNGHSFIVAVEPGAFIAVLCALRVSVVRFTWEGSDEG